MAIRDWITARLAAFLTRPVGHYERHGACDFAGLRREIRKGDVLLIEGDQRVSALIKSLTHSSWSHAALYIGDEILRRGSELRERSLETFGEGAEQLLVEALFDGVVVAPLGKYRDFNVRLCRPLRLRSEDLAVILDDAVNAIGWRYDLRNIVDLAIHLVRASLLPGRHRRDVLRLGSGAHTEVICTSLLGRLFHRVGFPVLPTVTFPEGQGPEAEVPRGALGIRLRRRREPYPGVFRQRHPTLLTPRDFDLSPYFEIVKFSHLGKQGFDYHRIAWADDPHQDVA